MRKYPVQLLFTTLTSVFSPANIPHIPSPFSRSPSHSAASSTPPTSSPLRPHVSSLPEAPLPLPRLHRSSPLAPSPLSRLHGSSPLAVSSPLADSDASSAQGNRTPKKEKLTPFLLSRRINPFDSIARPVSNSKSSKLQKMIQPPENSKVSFSLDLTQAEFSRQD